MAESQQYSLARGYRAASRLNLQHYLWKQSAGYLIHPNIPLVDGQHVRITDIGTGTGIWLLDLGESLPRSSRLDGYDIDVRQCPPTQWLPENVTMRTLDVYDPIPEDLIGQYDIIHIRYFICVVRDSNPAALPQTFLKMLKPNGWLQWSEIDLKTIEICAASPQTVVGHTEALMDFVISPNPDWKVESQHWVATLRQSFEKAGFEEVQEDRRKRLPWTLPSLHDTRILLAEEFGAELHGNSAARQDMIQSAAREFENQERGVGMHSEIGNSRD
ncbi:MAG: hypothetical protein MMC33_009594 [Icmadophila ericetorum]|nr:hypothetical protein [Icmadophila ericetorum]